MDLNSSASESSSHHAHYLPILDGSHHRQPNGFQNKQPPQPQLVVRLLEGTKKHSEAARNGEERNTNNGIFGDIPEPQSYQVFDKLWVSSTNDGEVMLKNQWNSIRSKLQTEEINRPFNLSTPQVTAFFDLCCKLKVSSTIRFRAVELYSRYLQLFSEKMGDYLMDCSKEESDEFYSRFEAQIILRMCTCIIIASKLHSDSQSKVLKLTVIVKLLRNCGTNYSVNNIIRSELRVLETLDYKCHWIIPLDGVEQLLAILKLNIEYSQRSYYYCTLLLEYSYSEIGKIRQKFHEVAQQKNYKNNRATSHLMCAAIVAAGLFIVAAECKNPEINQRVAKAAQLPDEEVNGLTVLILDFLNGCN